MWCDANKLIMFCRGNGLTTLT